MPGAVGLRGHLRGNVRLVSFTNLIQGLHQNMLHVVLQPFVLTLTQSATLLGVLQSIGSRMGGLAGAAVQPLGGHLSDQRGRRPVILLSGVLNVGWFLLLILSWHLQRWEILIPAFALQGAALMRMPAVQATVAESVPMEGRGAAFSTTMFFFILPGAAMALVGGILADRAGVQSILYIALALEGLTLLLFFRYLRETLALPRAAKLASRSPWEAILPPRHLRGYFAAVTTDAFAWGMGSLLLYGFLSVAPFNFTNTDLGIIGAVWALAFALGLLPMARLIHRFGCKRMMIYSEVIGIVGIVMWLLSREVWLFVLAAIPGGLTAATWVPVHQTLLANAVAMDERGRMVGRVAAFRGLLSFPAPFLGGLLYDWGGFAVPMVANLTGAGVATLIIAFMVVDVPTRAEAPPVVRATPERGR